MLRPLFALALLAAATAGCIGTEEPPEEEVVKSDECDDGVGATCVCFDCEGFDPEPNFEAAPPVITSTPFEFTGNTGGAVCPPGQRSHCVTVEESRIDAPELQGGEPRAIVANVTWSAVTPATSRFYVSILADRGDGWEWDPETSPSVDGESPLRIDWDLSAYPEGTRFVLYFECFQAVDAGPARAAVIVPQDFAVAGAFLHAVS